MYAAPRQPSPTGQHQPSVSLPVMKVIRAAGVAATAPKSPLLSMPALIATTRNDVADIGALRLICRKIFDFDDVTEARQARGRLALLAIGVSGSALR